MVPPPSHSCTGCLLTTSSLSTSLFPICLPCLFVSLMFLFKASKDTLPPHNSLTPPFSASPSGLRPVRMICKLQTTESPGLVSSAHLGNSISQRGTSSTAHCSPHHHHQPRPSCPLCPLSSVWSLHGLRAANVSLQPRKLMVTVRTDCACSFLSAYNLSFYLQISDVGCPPAEPSFHRGYWMLISSCSYASPLSLSVFVLITLCKSPIRLPWEILSAAACERLICFHCMCLTLRWDNSPLRSGFTTVSGSFWPGPVYTERNMSNTALKLPPACESASTS